MYFHGGIGIECHHESTLQKGIYMEMIYLIKGIIIGFSIAAPVGPLGILTIQRTLAGGWKAGLATGMGAATADALYGCVAGFGLTIVSGLLMDLSPFLLGAGGFFLCGLGILTLTRSRSRAGKITPPRFKGHLSSYLSAFFLTLTNPATIMAFLAIFAGLGLGTAPGKTHLNALVLVLGVFTGSGLWWLILALGTDRFSQQITGKPMKRINQAAGIILLGFGIWALGSLAA